MQANKLICSGLLNSPEFTTEILAETNLRQQQITLNVLVLFPLFLSSKLWEEKNNTS